MRECGFMQGMCTGTPPSSFDLREPMPPGACAIRVRQDFLEAPAGTTCLLIDSLYIVSERTAASESAVHVLHVRPSPLCMIQMLCVLSVLYSLCLPCS